MAGRTHIEWAEMTWNPVTGCTKVSPGCKHCYAETMAQRLQAMGVRGYENGFSISLIPERLDQPRVRKTPTVWFVNSMSDLFHPLVPFAFIDRVLDVINETPRHIYQILTKRPERMSVYFDGKRIPENAWLGVTVEDRRYGVPRIEYLRHISASIRFLSIEPLLEDVGPLDLNDIHWAIVGGESGAGARRMQPEWVLRIRDQCLRDNVPFFFKQWGAFGADGIHRPKRKNGRLLEGRLYNAMPAAFKTWTRDTKQV